MSTSTQLATPSAAGALAGHEAAIALQHVDTLATHTAGSIGDGRVTGIAQQLLNYDPEAMVWQDSPHLAYMLPSVLKWIVIAALWLAAVVLLAPYSAMPDAKPGQSAAAEQAVSKHAQKKKARKGDQGAQQAAAAPSAASDADAAMAPAAALVAPWYTGLKWLGLAIIAWQLAKHLAWALRLKCIKYKVSSQRLIVESGIFSKTSNTYELHQLQTGQVHSPFFLRMFGCANLYIGVWLIGIRHAEAVRDLVRNAGQIEASRADKARWR